MNTSSGIWDNKRFSLIVTLLCIAIVLGKTLFISLPYNPMSWDAFGYYLYLPLSIIHQDLRIEDFSIVENIIETYKNSPTFYQGHKSPSGNWVIKYPVGWAIFYLPFFLIGHLFALGSDYPVDGFSRPYFWAVVSAHLTYACLGLLLVRKALQKLFNHKIVALTIITITIGTNFFHQSTSAVAMPHTLIFFQLALILNAFINWQKDPSPKRSLFLGILVGLAMSTRPTEVVILALPFFLGFSFTKRIHITLFQHIKEHYKKFLQIGMGVALGVVPQLLYWKYTTGSWVYYSYQNPGEGLDLHAPHTLNFLFSFRKGWLIYTPVMVFAILGFKQLYDHKRSLFLPVLIYFIANLYLVSSWTNWWYGSSFGQRPMVQSYAIMAIPLAAFFAYAGKNKITKIGIWFGLVFFITLNLFQTWQMRKGILDGSRLTAAYYFKAFGKTEKQPEWEKLLLLKRSDTGIEKVPDLSEYRSKVIYYEDYESIEDATTTVAHKGKKSWRSSASAEYSPALSIRYRDLTTKDHAWIKMESRIMIQDTSKECNVMLAASMSHRTKSYYWKGFDLKKEYDLIPNQWIPITLYYLTPEIRSTRNRLTVHFWYRPGADMFIDETVITAFTK
ncbi:MAG: hypothetical protein MRY83_19690 [Flavobacteriales bacterium]|nr:hypothetical protein [Flavobacteriales bacterium]